MSIYSTRFLSREEAIEELMAVWKQPHAMTNEELEDAMYAYIGREGLPNTPLNNYIIKETT